MALKVTFSISISKTKTKLKPFVLKTKPIVLPNILLFWQFERASECGKGQLISNVLLVSSNLPKNQRNFLQDFCPSL